MSTGPTGGRNVPSPTRKFSFWREEARRAWSELRGPATTPARAAVSTAVGIFVGSLPIFGCHTPIVIALCLWFQLDAAVAWIASNVSNPFFAPALLAAEVQIGAWIRRGSALALDPAAMRTVPVRHLVGYLALGAPVAGALLAAIGATAAYGIVALAPAARASRPPYRLPENAPPWLKAVERVASRYASPSSPIARERTRFHYLRAKLLADPAPRVVADIAGAALEGFGAVLDIGTGRGQVPMMLLELGRASSACGIDWDAAKIADARRAVPPESAHAKPIANFLVGDLRATAFEPADTVLLIDVLHYFSEAEQDAILDRAAAAVRPGGRILVRDADTRRGWRSWTTLIEEWVFTFLHFNRGERVRFRPTREIAARLESAGLACAVRSAWGKTPFSNVLVVGERRRHPTEQETGRSP